MGPLNSQVNVIETYPALIGYDEDVFNYFREQSVTLRVYDEFMLTCLLPIGRTFVDST